jgi:3' exoribonuclease, RNase T-like
MSATRIDTRKKVFLDTEFMELGHQRPIYLISIGLVDQDGREYYAIDESAPLHLASEWVKENVIPNLCWEFARDRATIAREILDFVGPGVTPEFWGWFADYDWVLFCQLFKTMLDLPKDWPHLCMDLKQYWIHLGRPKMPEIVNPKEHLAISDARWNKKVWEHLDEVRRKKGFPR